MADQQKEINVASHMAFKYQKQYRLPGFNYANAGYDFVTICAKNRECYFGDITNNEMRLSKIGKIVAKCWRAIPNHFDFVSLDEWCVQPNHLHGIVVKNENRSGRNAPWRVPTKNRTTIHPLIKKSLSSIINHYKGAVQRVCNKRGLDFAWQPRFHDHIIRTKSSLQNIRQYVKHNHLRWKSDIFHPDK